MKTKLHLLYSFVAILAFALSSWALAAQDASALGIWTSKVTEQSGRVITKRLRVYQTGETLAGEFLPPTETAGSRGIPVQNLMVENTSISFTHTMGTRMNREEVYTYGGTLVGDTITGTQTMQRHWGDGGTVVSTWEANRVGSDAGSSHTQSGVYAPPTGQMVGDIMEMEDMNGDRVGVVIRSANNDDFAAQSLILKHPNIKGLGLAILELIRQENGEITDMLPFGDDQRPFEYWHDLTQKILAMVDTVTVDVPPAAIAGTPPEPARQRPFVMRHGGPLLYINASSDAVKQIQGGTAMLYQLSPNHVTAVGAIAGEGLEMLDQLGGGKGVKYIGNPLFGVGLVLPTDPRAAALNLGRMTINPLQQAAFYEHSFHDLVDVIPGGDRMAQALGPIRAGLQQMGNLPVLHTTPNRALQRWQQNPRIALINTLGPVANLHVGGTTPGHAINSWTSNPVNAAKKTWKSVFH